MMDEKVVVITGGVRGIGKATSIMFAENGYFVIATTRNGNKKKDIEEMFNRNHNVNVVVEELNVNKEENVENFFKNIYSKYGRIDCLVNNAGIMIDNMPLHETSYEGFEKIIQTDVFGVYFCMKHVITEMLKQGHGSIVNVASVAGLVGSYNSSLYSAAKHAVIGLTKCGALDYATKNIRINAVAPGCIKTEIFEDAFNKGIYSEKDLAFKHPMKRFGTPDEVARSIFFLANDDNSFTTGTVLVVDGGYTSV